MEKLIKSLVIFAHSKGHATVSIEGEAIDLEGPKNVVDKIVEVLVASAEEVRTV